MSDNRKEIFKQRPAVFADTNNARLVRAVRNEERIRSHRAEHYSRHRNIATDPEIEVTRSRRQGTSRLERWRAERAIKTKIEQRKKKPIFKVGIVHHKFYSPVVSHKTKTIPQPCHPRGGLAKVGHKATPPKRITRATQKRLEAKNRAGALTPAVTSKASSSKSKSAAKCKPLAKRVMQQSFAPENYSFKAPSGISEIPMFGRIVIPKTWATESPKAPNMERPSTSSTAQNEQPSPQRQWSSSVEISMKLAMEKPWPAQDSSNVTIPQKMRNRMVRQAAIERYSQEPAPLESATNSSVEGSFRLRLSSEDENTEEQKISEESSSPESENVETDVIESNGVATKTSSRPSTPVPAAFSPYIVMSRGKDSARKEQQNRMGIRRSSANDIPTKDTVMQNLNISVEEEEQTANYFKHLVERETERLNDLCAEWETIKSESNISEDAGYQINAAIGQTNLLLRKKFTRFQSLIHDCETGKGEMLVRCKDLEGFWELMNREIKDCESRFMKLKILQSNDWVESESVVAKVTKKKTTTVPAKAKINVKSSARSWILAARKKKMSQNENLDSDAIAGQTAVEDVPLGSRIMAGVKVQTPKKTIATPKKTPTPLLKRVQVAQATKTICSPLAVIKISKMYKTPEVTLDDTISYVNSDQTPGKGILKKSDSASESDTSEPKSSRKVDFNDEVFAEEFPSAEVDEALQNSIDLGRALARIDTYDSDEHEPVGETSNDLPNVTLRKVRLDFEDEIFDEPDTAESTDSVAAVPESLKVPIINVMQSTPAKISTTKTSSRSTRRSSRRSTNINEVSVDEEQSRLSTMVLRNRTIVVNTPSKINRRSRRSSMANEINISITNTSFKENCDPQRETKIGSNNSDISKILDTEHENEDISHKRRSTRKSVRFNPDDDCKACGETPKPKQPMTPHSRDRKRVSLLGEGRRESVMSSAGGDLISFETPAKHPSRTRKSLCK